MIVPVTPPGNALKRHPRDEPSRLSIFHRLHRVPISRRRCVFLNVSANPNLRSRCPSRITRIQNANSFLGLKIIVFRALSRIFSIFPQNSARSFAHCKASTRSELCARRFRGDSRPLGNARSVYTMRPVFCGERPRTTAMSFIHMLCFPPCSLTVTRQTTCIPLFSEIVL